MYYTTKTGLRNRFEAMKSEGVCIEDKMQMSLSDTVLALNEQIKQTDSFESLLKALPDDVELLQEA